ncbi:PA14 domain protein [Phaeobacter sp. CECT 5382]|nr:PA14 domain protein [Phaeobacter sp. CECT 5382]
MVAGQLQLKPGVALDHEAAAEIAVEVTATDAAGLSVSESFTVAVADVNEAPETLTLDGGSDEVDRNGAFEGRSAEGGAGAGGSPSFAASHERIEVVAGQLQLKPGVALDHEAAAEIAVEVTATDAAGLSVSESFTVAVADVNEAPENLTLDVGNENLVRNGSFEEFDLSRGNWRGFGSDESGAWTDENGIEIWDNLGGVQASDGEQLMEMDHGYGVDSISQVIQTEGGQLYDLGMDLRERLTGGTDTVEVYWNDELVAKVDPQSSAWETFQMQVVGTGEDKLELREPDGESDSYGALIDNISLVAAENAVAENVEGAAVGRLSFDDPDASDSHTFEVSDDRFEVVAGELRLKPGVALDHEAESSLQVEVTVTDQGGLSTSESFTVDVADVAEMSVSSGFHARYFDVNQSLRELDDMDWNADPTHQEVTTVIDYENSSSSFWEDGSKDTFGAEISGNIQVDESGTFEFFLGGDDGAVLVVDGVPVVDHDGLHAYQTRSGEIDLEPGTHHIEVRYFENYGHAGLTLEWEGPGLDGRQLVTAPDMADAQTVGGVPLTLNVEMGTLDLSGDTSLVLSGLPDGSIVEVGEKSLLAGPDGAVDLTGWDGDILAITPPVDFTGPVEAELLHVTSMNNGLTHESTQAITFDVNAAHHTAPSGELVSGFHASYFDVSQTLSSLDQIDWGSDPTHEEFVREIDYENGAGSFWEGGATDTFGARIEGQVTVEEGGAYSFYLGGDDGAVLYINGEKVVDNDGLHSFYTHTGEIELAPGTYDIEVRYFENYGHAGLKLEWDGPDTDGRETLQADPGVAVEENGTFEVGVQLHGTSDQATVTMEGLPENTLLMSGDDTAISDGGPIDLSGWNTDYLEISSPPGFEGSIEGEIIISDTGFNGAPLTSQSGFTLEVGDAGAPQLEEAPEVLEIHAAVGEEIAPDNASWDADVGDAASDERETTDVMAEPVVTDSSSEIISVETETYERFDW